MFFDFSFGGSVNNGQIYSSKDSRLNLGANLLFRESVELGYRFENGISVSLFFDHTSNGGLDTYNDGLNNLGGRIGYRF
jgi:lipid A 3-O-deacylase